MPTPHAYNLRDSLLTVTQSLPDGAATVQSDGIEVHPPGGAFLADCEVLIQAPALTSLELGDSETVTYDVIHSDDDSAYSTLYSGVLIQTGDTGADAAESRVRLPTDVKRYVAVQATKTGADQDASGESVTASIVT